MDKIEKANSNTSIINTGETQAVALAVAENVGQIEVGDLTRIGIPGSGGTVFEIPTLEDTLAEKVISCIIVAAQDVRVYFEGKYEESSGDPPECYSPDARTGIGTPGGDCLTCPLAQWGSANDGRGQRCTARKSLIIMTGYSALPYIISAPPTSLKAARQYLLALAGKGYRYTDVETLISLNKVKSGGGIDYAQLVFKLGRVLTPEEAQTAKQMQQTMLPILAAAVPSRDSGTTQS